MRTTLLALFLAATPAAGLAMDTHAGHGSHSAMADGVHTTGEVHAIDGTMVNLTHAPIPEIGWPAMTMDLPLLEGADTGGVAPGDKVVIMLEQGPDGLYGVRALERSE